MPELFAVISGLILFAGAPPYLFDILKGKTKPERASWFIWAVLSGIALVSQISLHGGWSLVFVSIDALGNALVFLLALRYGVGGWTKLDKLALAIAATGVVLSLISRQPTVALVGVVAADAAGIGLTIRKAYLHPATETSVTWFFLGTASLFGALAVGSWKPQLLIYPVYMVVGNYAVLLAQGLGYGRHKAFHAR